MVIWYIFPRFGTFSRFGMLYQENTATLFFVESQAVEQQIEERQYVEYDPFLNRLPKDKITKTRQFVELISLKI
jgi:hypothetical protein